MPEFRLDYIDRRGAIAAHDTFECDDDVVALMVADRLLDACAEFYQSYELWCGPRRVLPPPLGAVRGAGHDMPPGRHLVRAAQETVLERERTLLDSQSAIGRSQRLIATTNKLLAQLTRQIERKPVRPRDS